MKFQDINIKREQRDVKKPIFYGVLYSASFLMLLFIIFSVFKESGKSFVWKIDGLNQHYPIFQYYSDLLKNLVQGKEMPMVDFRVGMGFDVITTLSYYAIGDPLSLLLVFANSENMEEFYRFLILFRFYLAGGSFLLYCFYRKKDGFASVMGALIYVFCGYMFYAGPRHPCFINPMIYLPLLFMGVEQVLKKKNPFGFIFMVFISALSNFYFLYMLTILMFVYAIIRFFYTYKEPEKPAGQQFFFTLLRAGFYYLLGIAQAAFFLLPVVGSFMNNGRISSGSQVNLLHYSKGYYVLMANSFLAPNIYTGYWTNLTYAAFAAIGLLIIFRSNKYKELRIAFILATISLMIPAIGYFMNGFAYVANRWGFGYSFLIAIIFTSTYKDMFRLKVLDQWILFVGIGIYFLLGLIRPNKYIGISLIFLCFSVLAVVLFNRYKNTGYLQKVCIFLLIFCNLGTNGYLTYHRKYGNYVSEFVDAGKVQDTIEMSAFPFLPQVEDDSFYRVETFGDSCQNEALMYGYYDVSSYFSLTDKHVSEFMKDMEVLSLKTSFRFDNLDNRTALGTLANVKYMAGSSKKAASYGYKVLSEKVLANGKTTYLLENQNALPLGYTYKYYITKESYNTLTALEKQEMMLEAIVLDEPVSGMTGMTAMGNAAGESKSFKEGTEIIQLTPSYETGKDITFAGDVVKVAKKGAKLRITFAGIKDAETYVRLNDFHINDTDYFSIDLKVRGEKGVTKTVNVRAKKNNSYFGKDDYLVNLGYRKEARTYCELTFFNIGRFHLGDLQVYALPMKNYTAKVDALKKYALTNTVLGNNRITGSMDLLEDRLLCLSIPYSKGWTAYVNDKRTPLRNANVMYMALPLHSGDNQIELRYETPFLREGVIIAIIGWSVYLGLILIFILRKSSH